MAFSSMPLYTGAYLEDTRGLSPQEHGTYLLLLIYCWDRQSPVPLDEQEQGRICNAHSDSELETLRRILNTYFTRRPDGWHNTRMTAETARANEISKSRKQSAAKRWQKDKNNNQIVHSTMQVHDAVQQENTPKKNSDLMQVHDAAHDALASEDLFGKEGAQNAAVKRKNGAEKKEPQTPLQIACRSTWSSFVDAYFLRYQVAPARNARSNSQVKAFVQLVGGADAPNIAAFYVRHNDSFFVRAAHDVGLLVPNAQKLRTEWLRGVSVTGAQARSAERTGSNAEAVKTVIERIENEEAHR